MLRLCNSTPYMGVSVYRSAFMPKSKPKIFNPIVNGLMQRFFSEKIKGNNETGSKKKSWPDQISDRQVKIAKLRNAVENGDPEALYNLANALFSINEVEAVKYLKRAAEKEHLSAMSKLGMLLYTGARGVEKNIKLGIELIKKAASEGDPDAILNLGYIYERGEGVKRDFIKAIELYKKIKAMGYVESREYIQRLSARLELEKLAEEGNADAQYELALLYLNVDVGDDAVTARELLFKAADQRHFEAKRLLIKLLCKGIGGPVNEPLAAALLVNLNEIEKECNPGILADMAIFYLTGTGFFQSPELALEYLEKAKNLGDDESEINIQKIKKEIINNPNADKILQGLKKNMWLGRPNE